MQDMLINKPAGAKCIIFDGPFPDQCQFTGEEVASYFVGFGDDDGCELGGGSHYRSYEYARQVFDLACRTHPKLERVMEATRD